MPDTMSRIEIAVELQLADTLAKLQSLRASLASLKAEEADILRRQGPWAGGIFVQRQTQAIQEQIASLSILSRQLDAVIEKNNAFAIRPQSLTAVGRQIADLENVNRIRERSLDLVRQEAEAQASRVAERAVGTAAFAAGAAGLPGVAMGTESLRASEGAREAHQRLNQNLIQDSAQYYAQERALRARYEAERQQGYAEEVRLAQQASAAKAAFYAGEYRAATELVAQEAVAQSQYQAARVAGLEEEKRLAAEAAALKSAIYEKDAREQATSLALEKAKTEAIHGQVAAIRALRSGTFGDQSSFLQSLEPAQGRAALQPGTFTLGRTHTAELKELTEAQKAVNAAQAAGAAAARGSSTAIKEVGTAAAASASTFTIFIRELRHAFAVMDEGLRGQRSMQFASLGASVRDLMSGTVAGVGAVVATATVLTTVAAVATLALSRMVSHMGELAEKLQNNAAATGLTVEQFSLLQRTMQLASGDADRSVVTFGRLATAVQSALANPTSRAASAFLQLGISQQQLRSGLQDLPGFLELLRQKFESMPASMQRTMLFRDAIGVGFQHIISTLRETSSEAQKFEETARRSFSVIDEHAAKQLEVAAQRSYEFKESLSGLGIQLGLLASNFVGPINYLTSFVRLLSEATEGWRMLFAATEEDRLRIVADKLKREGQFFTEPPKGFEPTRYPSPNETPEQQAQVRETEARLDRLRTATPGVTTTELNSPTPEISSMKRELDENVRLITEQRGVREAALNLEIKRADTNAERINELERQKTAVAEQSIAQERSLRQAYYDRYISMADNANDSVHRAEAERLLDAQRTEKQVLDIQAQAVQTENVHRRASYEIFARTEENKIRESRGDWNTIANIISEWRARATSDFHGVGEDYDRAMERIHQATIAAQEQRFRSIEENISSQNRVSDLQLRIQEAQLKAEVASHGLSKAQEAQAEVALTAATYAQMEARLQAAVNEDGLNFAQKQKLYEQLSELYLRDAEKQEQAAAKATAAIEAENKRRVQALTQMFDSIGSTLERSVVGALTGQPTKITDFYKAIFTDVARAATSIGSQLIGKALAPTLGVKVAEGEDSSIGGILGRALGNMLGLTRSAPNNQTSSAALLQKASEAASQAASLSGRAATQMEGAGVKFLSASDTFKSAVDKFVTLTPTAAQSPSGKQLADTIPTASPGRVDRGGGYEFNSVERTLDLIEKDESNRRNVPNFRYDATHTAQGNFQITNQTWREFAPRAGVDVTQFPNAMSAPYDVQRNVARTILTSPDGGIRRWSDYNPTLRADLPNQLATTPAPVRTAQAANVPVVIPPVPDMSLEWHSPMLPYKPGYEAVPGHPFSQRLAAPPSAPTPVNVAQVASSDVPATNPITQPTPTALVPGERRLPPDTLYNSRGEPYSKSLLTMSPQEKANVEASMKYIRDAQARGVNPYAVQPASTPLPQSQDPGAPPPGRSSMATGQVPVRGSADVHDENVIYPTGQVARMEVLPDFSGLGGTSEPTITRAQIREMALDQERLQQNMGVALGFAGGGLGTSSIVNLDRALASKLETGAPKISTVQLSVDREAAAARDAITSQERAAAEAAGPSYNIGGERVAPSATLFETQRNFAARGVEPFVPPAAAETSRLTTGGALDVNVKSVSATINAGGAIGAGGVLAGSRVGSLFGTEAQAGPQPQQSTVQLNSSLQQNTAADQNLATTIETTIQNNTSAAQTTANAIQNINNSSQGQQSAIRDQVQAENNNTAALQKVTDTVQSKTAAPSSTVGSQASTGGTTSTSTTGDKLLSGLGSLAGLAGLYSSITGQRQSPYMRALTGGLSAISTISGLFSKSGLFGSEGLFGGLFGGGGGIFSAIGSLFALDQGGIIANANVVSAAGGHIIESSLAPAIRSNIVSMAQGGNVASFRSAQLINNMRGTAANDGKGGQLIIAHPGEMVVPAFETSQILNSMRGGGVVEPERIMSAAGGMMVGTQAANIGNFRLPSMEGGGAISGRMDHNLGGTVVNEGDTHNHYTNNISAVDAHSVDRLIVSRPRAVSQALAAAHRGNSPYSPR